MATNTLLKNQILRPSIAPNLPIAPVEYSQQYVDQLSNMLRLYFAQVDNFSGGLLAIDGGGLLKFPYGQFLSTTTQTVTTINTATRVTLDTIDLSNSVGMTSSQITFTYSGVYRIIFSAQLTNTDTQAHDVDIWYRINGVDLPNSATVQTVQGTHGGQPGYQHALADGAFKVKAGDYFELWWSSNSTLVQLAYLPAITTPFASPGAPAMDVTVTFVSAQ